MSFEAITGQVRALLRPREVVQRGSSRDAGRRRHQSAVLVRHHALEEGVDQDVVHVDIDQRRHGGSVREAQPLVLALLDQVGQRRVEVGARGRRVVEVAAVHDTSASTRAGSRAAA